MTSRSSRGGVTPPGRPRGRRGTYVEAGVDIEVALRTKRLIAKAARTTFRPEVITDIGFFGSMFSFKGYRNPILVSSADGVGTKIKIACAMGKHEGIGTDIVSHSVNDIFCGGATPLYFLDYIAMGKLVPEVAAAVAKGMAKACREVKMALVGGETAQMPGMYAEGEYDVVGFITGVVEKDEVIDGRSIKAGDVLLGLPSAGLHTNGFSLVRRVFNLDADSGPLKRRCADLGRTLGEALLEPHYCYYNAIWPFLPLVKGLAHVTGGGMPENIPRILPDGLGVLIEKSTWAVPPLFRLIQKRGRIEEAEMYRVFNMGIGMVAITAPDDAGKAMRSIKGASVIGEVVKARNENELVIIK